MGICGTGSNSSDQRLQGDGPGIVPSTNDEDDSKGLRMHEDLIRYGEEVLLHWPRSCPLGELLDGELDLTLHSQSLK